MKEIYSFVGKTPSNYYEDEIKSLLPTLIANQNKPYDHRNGDDNPEMIEIVDFAYSKAMPNCYIVFASWSLYNSNTK